MKLNNILIVTLSDFARHFTFPAFWTNRQQFVRDLCPEKVYYLNHEHKLALAHDSSSTLSPDISRVQTVACLSKMRGM